MATFPYFFLGPNTVASIIGLIHGPDKTVPTPPEDWKKAVVDVVIPAYNEENNIVFCLESILRQTFKPRRIILVDDGSTDNTCEYAENFAKINNLELTIIRREKSIGKTPTLREQAKESDADILFILDGDTFLDSDNYIERTVEELYKAVGIASACGIILPIRDEDKINKIDIPEIKKFCSIYSDVQYCKPMTFWEKMKRVITINYREILYNFLQRFIYKGQMVVFGTILNPVGCAVAYRRKYLKELFDKYYPVLGDNLTNSEDIFIGFAFTNYGYRNIQLQDVYAKTTEPKTINLPKQIYFWSSSFFQCCYYFDSLIKTPFKAIRRWRYIRDTRKKIPFEKRKIKEPYRQSFSEEYTKKYGRPIGWIIFTSALEKIAFPIVLLYMLLFRLWEPLYITVLIEVLFSAIMITIVVPEKKLKYFLKDIIITPVRYSTLFFDLFVMMRFAYDLWFTKNRRWRK